MTLAVILLHVTVLLRIGVFVRRYLGGTDRMRRDIASDRRGRLQRQPSPGQRSVSQHCTDGGRSRPSPPRRGHPTNILHIHSRSEHIGTPASFRTATTSSVLPRPGVRSSRRNFPSDRLLPHLQQPVSYTSLFSTHAKRWGKIFRNKTLKEHKKRYFVSVTEQAEKFLDACYMSP